MPARHEERRGEEGQQAELRGGEGDHPAVHPSVLPARLSSLAQVSPGQC